MDKEGEIRKLRSEIEEIREDPEIVRKSYAIEMLMKRQKEAEEDEISPIDEVYKLKGYCKSEKEEEVKMGG